jgi:hypothetical protein
MRIDRCHHDHHSATSFEKQGRIFKRHYLQFYTGHHPSRLRHAYSLLHHRDGIYTPKQASHSNPSREAIDYVLCHHAVRHRVLQAHVRPR